MSETLNSDTDHNAEAAWDQEVAKREAEIKGGEEAGEPAEQVFSALRAKYARS